MRLMITCVLGRLVASSLISTETFQKALTASVDSCAEKKSAPSVASLNLAQSLEEGAAKRCIDPL